MTLNKKLEGLQDGLKFYKFPERFFVQISDRRIGCKFAIASKTESSLSIHTDFMTYDEFNAYLFGYQDAKNNSFAD